MLKGRCLNVACPLGVTLSKPYSYHFNISILLSVDVFKMDRLVAYSEDPDEILWFLIWVYTVCTCLSVLVLGNTRSGPGETA